MPSVVHMLPLHRGDKAVAPCLVSPLPPLYESCVSFVLIIHDTQQITSFLLILL